VWKQPNIPACSGAPPRSFPRVSCKITTRRTTPSGADTRLRGLAPPPPSGKCEKIKSSDTEHLLPTRGQTSAPFLSYTHQFEFRAVVWFSNCNNFWVAVISAKNHKRQSVTAIREKSQTPKVLTVILTLRNLTKLNLS